MIDGPDRDTRAYELRSQGRSYGAIARELGYPNAPSATEAFLRVLHSRPAEAQLDVRAAEHTRLGGLAEHVKADTSLDPAAMTRRLAVIQRMHDAVDAVSHEAADRS
jgi:hypothetical protein